MSETKAAEVAPDVEVDVDVDVEAMCGEIERRAAAAEAAIGPNMTVQVEEHLTGIKTVAGQLAAAARAATEEAEKPKKKR